MPRFELILVRNPKTAQSFFVAKVNLEKEEIEFVKPVIYKYDSRGKHRIGGEYEFQPGDYIIVKYDESSHRNLRQTYVLYKVSDKLEEIAKVEVYNRAKEFVPKDLEEIYSEIENGKGKIVKTLVRYAKKIAKAEKENREEIFKELLQEIYKIIEKYEDVLKDYTPYQQLKNSILYSIKSYEEK